MRSSAFTLIICVIGLVSVAALWVMRPPVAIDESVAGADIGGAFTLTTHTGKTVTDKFWPHKYLLVYFGFTHCPDVCPLGLNTLTEALNALPAATQNKIQPLFITVDPQRDTAATLAEYIKPFYKNLVALTGSAAQVETVKKKYRVYAEKDGTGPDYMVNHSAFTYLMSPEDTVVYIFDHDTTADEMAAVLQEKIK